MSDTAPTPNIVDAAVALADEGPVVTGLLSAIFEHQQAEAARFESLQEGWFIESRATTLAMRDGILWALESCEQGGTTRNYERCLTRIANLLHPYGDHLAHYVDHLTEHGVWSEVPVWPGFQRDYGP